MLACEDGLMLVALVASGSALHAYAVDEGGSECRREIALSLCQRPDLSRPVRAKVAKAGQPTGR